MRGDELMVGDRSNQLLGELLTEAGLLEIDDLREAAHIARGQNLPIGKVLVMSGYISKELLKASIEVQSRLKDDQIEYDSAMKALNLVSTVKCSLEEALTKLGIEPLRSADSTSYRLGALLLGSSLVSQSDFDAALAESHRCGLPLGRVLVNLEILSEETIDDALGIQKLLRGGQITKEEAIESLVESKEKKLSDHENALAKAEQSNSQKLTASVETVSTTVETEAISLENAGDTLIKDAEQKTPNQAFPKLESLTLHHMLLMAGLVQTSALESAIKDGLKKPEIMGIILKRSGILEDFVIDAAQECCQLIAAGHLKPEQAIIVLHQCQRTRNSIRDCLFEFGWKEKSQIVW